MACKMVAYYRVSTERQGVSGLGLEAQKADVKRHVAGYGCDLVAEYTEIETGKRDTLDNRPQLIKAIAHAKRSKATLVIAKLDRLARSTYITATLHKAEVDFVCCDNPHANRLTIQILAAVAENEALVISQRTKAALAAKKARGEKLGSARDGAHRFTATAQRNGSALGAIAAARAAIDAYADLSPTLRAMQKSGKSLREMAASLNADGHSTRRGKPWNAMQVSRVLERL